MCIQLISLHIVGNKMNKKILCINEFSQYVLSAGLEIVRFKKNMCRCMEFYAFTFLIMYTSTYYPILGENQQFYLLYKKRAVWYPLLSERNS